MLVPLSQIRTCDGLNRLLLPARSDPRNWATGGSSRRSSGKRRLPIATLSIVIRTSPIRDKSIVLFLGALLGWLVGTALELKSIFKGNSGEFRAGMSNQLSSVKSA